MFRSIIIFEENNYKFKLKNEATQIKKLFNL